MLSFGLEVLMTKIISKNPGKNYEVIGEVESSTDIDIKEAVEHANKAKTGWNNIGVEKRVEYLKPILEEMKKRSKEIAELMTEEMGNP
jgi:acyl-CoA reductase-like NAD-dependent aldehyde dehydrogenase